MTVDNTCISEHHQGLKKSEGGRQRNTGSRFLHSVWPLAWAGGGGGWMGENYMVSHEKARTKQSSSHIVWRKWEINVDTIACYFNTCTKFYLLGLWYSTQRFWLNILLAEIDFVSNDFENWSKGVCILGDKVNMLWWFCNFCTYFRDISQKSHVNSHQLIDTLAQ